LIEIISVTNTDRHKQRDRQRDTQRDRQSTARENNVLEN